jgi:type IV pilus assembly protein PilA
MVELMVTLLVIAVLIVIALPTFLGARWRAQDRHAQVDVRIAFTAERAYYTDTLTYTTDPTAMTAIEPAITYLDGDTPLSSGVVYLHFVPAPNEIFLSAKSQSGNCFYLRELDGGNVGYAASPSCGVVDSQTYAKSW